MVVVAAAAAAAAAAARDMHTSVCESGGGAHGHDEIAHARGAAAAQSRLRSGWNASCRCCIARFKRFVVCGGWGQEQLTDGSAVSQLQNMTATSDSRSNASTYR